jgi:hypothetical protein
MRQYIVYAVAELQRKKDLTKVTKKGKLESSERVK